MDRLGRRVRDGTLDTLLVRPAPVLAQVAADRFALRRLGRVVQGLLVLGYALVVLDVDWTAAKLLLMPVMLLGGGDLRGGVRGGGGVPVRGAGRVGGGERLHLRRYDDAPVPADGVRAGPRAGVTFLVPLAFVNWLPASFVLDRPYPLDLPGWAAFTTPLVAVACGALAGWRGGRDFVRTGAQGAEGDGRDGDDGRGGHRGAGAGAFIELDGVEKVFDVRKKTGFLKRERRRVRAVDGLSFTVARGEMVGYIGPNGAGKSTTIKMLTGILTPSGGRLRVAGIDPSRERTRLAHRIGVVFGQRTTLWWTCR